MRGEALFDVGESFAFFSLSIYFATAIMVKVAGAEEEMAKDTQERRSRSGKPTQRPKAKIPFFRPSRPPALRRR